MDNMKIGVFLQSLRKEKGLTQQELSALFDVSNKTVSKWECGDSLPEIPLLKALSEFYGVTVDEILNGERKLQEKTALIEEKKESPEPEEKKESSMAKENKAEMKEPVQPYVFKRNFSRLKLFFLLTYMICFLSVILFLTLTYTVHRQDVGSIPALAVLLLGFIPYVLGVFLYGRKEGYPDEYSRVKDFVFISSGIVVCLMGVLMFLYLYPYCFIKNAEYYDVSSCFMYVSAWAGPFITAALCGCGVYFIYLFSFKMISSANRKIRFDNIWSYLVKRKFILLILVYLYLLILFLIPLATETGIGLKYMGGSVTPYDVTGYAYLYSDADICSSACFVIAAILIPLSVIAGLLFYKNDVLSLLCGLMLFAGMIVMEVNIDSLYTDSAFAVAVVLRCFVYVLTFIVCVLLLHRCITKKNNVKKVRPVHTV